MKKALILLLSFCTYLNTGFGQTLVAGWDFQTTDNGGTAALSSPDTPTAFIANFGTASLYLDGNNGSSNWLSSELNSFTGTTLNAGSGFSTVTSGAASLALVNSTANGKSIVFVFNMTGYQNLEVSYATRRTSTGFNTQTWDYSTDGSTWVNIESLESLPTSFSIITLTEISGLDNSELAYLRLTVDGASSASGNNRIDNLQFNASSSCNTLLKGYFNYYNAAKTALDGVNIELKQSGTTIQSTSTNSMGYYEFTNVCPGDYDVVTTYSEPTGYINSTDAAQVNFWAVNLSAIEQTRFYAGDVTNDLSVNSSDAGLIQQHFLTLGNPSPAFVTDWVFWTAGETISANPGAGGYPTATVLIGEPSVSQDFYGLGTGDFNGSYTPGAKGTASKTLTLSYGDMIEVGLSEFELPLYAGMDMNVGAISLILDIPSDFLDVQDIYLENNPNMPLLYSVSGNEVRISWQSATTVSVQQGAPLVTLLLKLNQNPEAGEIRLSLNPSEMNELADNNNDVINNASLVVDIIKTTTLGIADQTTLGQIDLSSHPNPFTEIVSFDYYIPVDGYVKLEIYNMLGHKMKVVVNELQSAGDYLFKADGLNLQPGIYMANLRVDNKKVSFIRTIKIVSK